jgi:hypothetical protein
MCIENKSAQPPGQSGIRGPARIGRVSFSKTGKSLYYDGKTFQSLKGSGKKANYFDVDSHEEYWISGPKGNGADGMYGPRPTPINNDVREEYWTVIRQTARQEASKIHLDCGQIPIRRTFQSLYTCPWIPPVSGINGGCTKTSASFSSPRGTSPNALACPIPYVQSWSHRLQPPSRVPPPITCTYVVAVLQHVSIHVASTPYCCPPLSFFSPTPSRIAKYLRIRVAGFRSYQGSSEFHIES